MAFVYVLLVPVLTTVIGTVTLFSIVYSEDIKTCFVDFLHRSSLNQWIDSFILNLKEERMDKETFNSDQLVVSGELKKKKNKPGKHVFEYDFARVPVMVLKQRFYGSLQPHKWLIWHLISFTVANKPSLFDTINISMGDFHINCYIYSDCDSLIV